jgi:hypothetical protein
MKAFYKIWILWWMWRCAIQMALVWPADSLDLCNPRVSSALS